MKLNFKQLCLYTSLACIITSATLIANVIIDPPGRPENLRIVTSGTDWCELEFEEPKFDGHDPIISYKVEKHFLWGIWTKIGETRYDEFEYRAVNLTSDEVEFRVRAKNNAGVGMPYNVVMLDLTKEEVENN